MNTAAAERRLIGQTVLITGATGGIGHQTAHVLARSGAQVIITGRDPDTGEQAAAAIRRESEPDSVIFLRADHSTVGGNQDLADRVRAAVPRLNLLINNVGGLYPTRWETPDGYEATLAMNFVGPFALTAELLPLLRAGTPARCVNVVSAGFKMWNTDPFADVQSADRFVSGDAYAHTKLHNVLASLAWARRLTADQIMVNVVHPGLSWTHDPVDDRADDAVLAAGLAAAAAPAAPRVAGQGRPAHRLRRVLTADRRLHRPVLRGPAHTQPPIPPRARPAQPGPRLAPGRRTRGDRPHPPPT